MLKRPSRRASTSSAHKAARAAGTLATPPSQFSSPPSSTYARASGVPSPVNLSLSSPQAVLLTAVGSLPPYRKRRASSAPLTALTVTRVQIRRLWGLGRHALRRERGGRCVEETQGTRAERGLRRRHAHAYLLWAADECAEDAVCGRMVVPLFQVVCAPLTCENRETKRSQEIKELVEQGKIPHDVELQAHPAKSIQGLQCASVIS